MKIIIFASLFTVAAAVRRSVPSYPAGMKPQLSPYGPTKIGTWGLPKDKKVVKEVKRSVKKDEPKEKAMLWGIHSVSELEETMGLE
jgi:hypothetical protein